MKIAFIYDAIYPWVKGGAERRIYELATRLGKKGHDVHIIGIQWWEGEKVIQRDGITYHGVCRSLPLYVDGKRSIKEALVFSWGLLRYMRGMDFTICDVSSFPYFSCLSARIISTIQHTPMVITWHELWGNYWYKYFGWKGFFGKNVEKLIIKSSTHTIAVSNITKHKLVHQGVKDIFVIPNGIDVNTINTIPPTADEGYVSDIVFVGRLIEDKHVDVLIRAVQIVRTNIPDIHCTIIGNGPEYHFLTELSKNLDIEDHITFTGFLDGKDVIRYMKSSKIMVLPSTREGFGMVVVEAFACGLPVIGVTGEDSAVSELIDNGMNGFMVELSARTIAEKITEVLDDEESRAKMSANAIDTAKKHSWDRLVSEIEQVYEHVSKKQM